jgi:predicted Fe-Mo cluster-binding NifX family protein
MRINSENTLTISGEGMMQKIAWLTEHGIQTLVCGAVSRLLQEQLTAAGINVIPFVAGELPQVIQAASDGSLQNLEFRMPGCCGRRMMRRGGGRREGRGGRCQQANIQCSTRNNQPNK